VAASDEPFYSSEQTALSHAVLREVLAAVPAAILIGGWGSWGPAPGGPMSHDVDLIVNRSELAILEQMVGDLSESTPLGWYEMASNVAGLSILTCMRRSSPGLERTCNCASS